MRPTGGNEGRSSTMNLSSDYLKNNKNADLEEYARYLVSFFTRKAYGEKSDDELAALNRLSEEARWIIPTLLKRINEKHQFQISPKQRVKFEKWSKEQEAKAYEMQLVRKDQTDPELASSISPFEVTILEEMKKPYYGAIGGGYTWNFSPSSIGMLITVEHSITKEKLDFFDDL